MSAMRIEAPKGVLTVGKLLDYLEEMQKSWTEEDSKYMGDFRNQRIYTPHYNDKNEYLGIGHARIYYHGGLDFIVDVKDRDKALEEDKK